MRKLLYLVVSLPMLLLTSCVVHEWPETPEFEKLHLRLSYETNMTEWIHLCDGVSVVEHGLGKTYNNQLDHGKIRYIIRTYPVSNKYRTTQDYTQEFVFTKNISEGYDHEVMLDVLPGEYEIMVWSDLVQSSDDSYFYDADNFAEIVLSGDHKGNTDHRDAFRGSNKVTITTDIIESAPIVLDIVMQRPLAKFEFITTDVVEFILKESVRLELANKDENLSNSDAPTRVVNIEDYKVVFYYSGFMPNTYNMHLDKPVDSVMGVKFETTLKQLSETEASMGFDYMLVNGTEAAVMLQIGLYGSDDTQLSLTEPIKVPLKRNHHTIINGSFMMYEASGGIVINPDFDGEHNVVIP